MAKNGIIFLIVVGVLQFAAWSADIKVGIYADSTGSNGILEALRKESGFNAEMINDILLKPEDIFKYDVLVFGSLKGTEEGNIQAIRNYVKAGGGVLLHHDAVGYRGWNKALFPDICKGVRASNSQVLIPLPGIKHTIVKELPEKYVHAYSDHIILTSPKGAVLVKDEDGCAVVVAGNVGYGRVIGNGCVTGYFADARTQKYGESEPVGGERAVLLNSINWLGEKPITQLPAEEQGKRKSDVEKKWILSAKSQLSNVAWFGDEMLKANAWIRPPVSELEGRFFMFLDGDFVLSKMDCKQLVFYIRQLKWMGVTDIIYGVDIRGASISRPSDIPSKIPGVQISNSQRDLLKEILQSAAVEGIDVWAMWHSGPVPDSMAAFDHTGKIKYKYGNWSSINDVFSSEYRAFCHAVIDEYVVKYKAYSNFKGVYYDELWHNCVDFHGDDLNRMDKFFREQFGEGIPDDMAEKLTRGAAWLDPADKWWRRYILFKNQANTDFARDLVDYLHKNDFKLIYPMFSSAGAYQGWAFGMDNETLAHIGIDINMLWIVPSNPIEFCGAFPNTMALGHVEGETWGFQNTHGLRGHPTSGYFVDNQFSRLLTWGSNPHLMKQLEQFIRNNREWANSQSLTKIAILHDQNALHMLLGKNSREAAAKELAVLESISMRLDADIIMAGLTEYYKNYNVLIAPSYSLRGMSQTRFDSLLDYLKKGGTLISMSDATVSNTDITDERDMSETLFGIKTFSSSKASKLGMCLAANGKKISFSKTVPCRKATPLDPSIEVIAVFEDDGTPAVTRKCIGNGQAISIHADIMDEFKKGNNDLENWLWNLVAGISKPEITVEGGLKAITTLKKNNWIAVSLQSEKVPCKGKVRIDMSALGISHKSYRVIMLRKGMQIAAPGDFFNRRRGWTAEELKNGVAVTIVKDDDANMALPAEFNLEEYSKKDAKYINSITRSGWNREGVAKRNYDYEILVIAPEDEIGKGRP